MKTRKTFSKYSVDGSLHINSTGMKTGFKRQEGFSNALKKLTLFLFVEPSPF